MFHVVKKGDTLGRIAKQFGTTVAAFKAANPELKDIDLILTGQRLFVPQGSAGSSTPKPKEVSTPAYIVRSGDSMVKIASHLGVTLTELIAANPQVADPRLIRPSQLITVPENSVTKSVSTVTLPAKKGRPLWLVVAEREWTPESTRFAVQATTRESSSITGRQHCRALWHHKTKPHGARTSSTGPSLKAGFEARIAHWRGRG